MKITFQSKPLAKKLSAIGAVIASSNTLPVLDNFLFEVEPDIVKITASDLETTASTTIVVKSGETGSFAVDSKTLLELLKNFPDQPLTFCVGDNNVLEIISGQRKYTVSYFNADEYPKSLELDDAKTIALPTALLSQAIKNTLFATGNDDLRPQFSGVFFDVKKDRINFAATDAHKLARFTATDMTNPVESSFIVPRKTLDKVKALLPEKGEHEAILQFSDTNLMIDISDYVFICRLIDQKYPNYEAVIPKENPNVMTIGRNLLVNSLKCVSLFSNKTTHQIRLSFTGQLLTISSEDEDNSTRAEEKIPCQFEGEDMQIGFNARLLLEVLSNLKAETITLEMSLPNRAGILKNADSTPGEELLMLLMPVMLKV